jgi:hypothetical protein
MAAPPVGTCSGSGTTTAPVLRAAQPEHDRNDGVGLYVVLAQSAIIFHRAATEHDALLIHGNTCAAPHVTTEPPASARATRTEHNTQYLARFE